MTRRRAARASSVAIMAMTATLWLLLVACETPPSKYIPPPEPREIPNIDPPPGIPIMPSGSAVAKPSDGGTTPPSAGITLPTCKADRDCVVTAQTGCCELGDPRAELRTEVEKWKTTCKGTECADAEAKGDPKSLGDYVARCVKKSCTLVPKKKRGK